MQGGGNRGKGDHLVAVFFEVRHLGTEGFHADIGGGVAILAEAVIDKDMQIGKGRSGAEKSQNEEEEYVSKGHEEEPCG